MACLQEAVTDFRELAYTLLSDKVTLIMSVKVEAPLSVSTPQEFDWYFTGERDTEEKPQRHHHSHSKKNSKCREVCVRMGLLGKQTQQSTLSEGALGDNGT